VAWTPWNVVLPSQWWSQGLQWQINNCVCSGHDTPCAVHSLHFQNIQGLSLSTETDYHHWDLLQFFRAYAFPSTTFPFTFLCSSHSKPLSVLLIKPQRVNRGSNLRSPRGLSCRADWCPHILGFPFWGWQAAVAWRRFNATAHAWGRAHHILQYLVADESSKGVHAHPRTVLAVRCTSYCVQQACNMLLTATICNIQTYGTSLLSTRFDISFQIWVLNTIISCNTIRWGKRTMSCTITTS
jgi:hypothetical protein